MMAKFRIQKTEIIDGIKPIEVFYKAQQKFLFWWVDYRFKVVYATEYDDILYKERREKVAIVGKRKFTFDTISDVKFRIEIEEKPCIFYRGNKIQTVLTEDGKQTLFINLSYSRWSPFELRYECSLDLDGLYLKIDKRIKTVKKTIVE